MRKSSMTSSNSNNNTPKKPRIIPSTPNITATGAIGGIGQTPAWSNPNIVMSAPAGIALVTPQSASLNAGTTTALAAGQDINLMAGASAGHSVKYGISLFTYGKASNPKKPNQETGISLHAASGKVSSQSQSDKTQITADKAIQVNSTHDAVSIQAKEHVLLTAQGAYIKMSGGNIEVHAPGRVDFKATMKSWTSAKSDSLDLTHMPKPGAPNNFMELNYRWDDMQPMMGAPYKIKFDNGVTITGKLDAKGFARIEDVPNATGDVIYGEDEREAKPRKKQKPNQLLGVKATSDEQALDLLAKYLAQENAYLKDNYFPDEIDEMTALRPTNAAESILEYEFHYDDYKYEDEDSPEQEKAQQDYRAQHDREAPSDSGEGAAA
jgi:type VI secretion system secreted protein VgrG